MLEAVDRHTDADRTLQEIFRIEVAKRIDFLRRELEVLGTGELPVEEPAQLLRKHVSAR